jgi:hypothetical protein
VDDAAYNFLMDLSQRMARVSPGSAQLIADEVAAVT